MSSLSLKESSDSKSGSVDYSSSLRKDTIGIIYFDFTETHKKITKLERVSSIKKKRKLTMTSK